MVFGFAALALVCAAGLLGPLLVLPRRLRVPVVVGELAAGIGLGTTGLRLLDARDPTFSFLAQLGFALVMFVAGSHVPLRDPALRAGIGAGIARAAGVGVVATGLAVGVARLAGTGHVALYAVLLSSSSAALVLPIVASLDRQTPPVLGLVPQVAVADIACIVALPLAVDPAQAARAGVGALAVAAVAGLLYVVLRHLEASGTRRRIHRASQQNALAVELRVDLALVFALSAIAVWAHVSVLLAGFSFGLVVAAVGSPDGSRASCSPSPRASSARCSSSGSGRPSSSATSLGTPGSCCSASPWASAPSSRTPRWRWSGSRWSWGSWLPPSSGSRSPRPPWVPGRDCSSRERPRRSCSVPW